MYSREVLKYLVDKEYNYCLRCGRKLKSKENRLRGYGNICYKKVELSMVAKPLFNLEEYQNMDTERKLTEEQRQKYLSMVHHAGFAAMSADSEYARGEITAAEREKILEDVVKQLDNLEEELNSI